MFPRVDTILPVMRSEAMTRVLVKRCSCKHRLRSWHRSEWRIAGEVHRRGWRCVHPLWEVRFMWVVLRSSYRTWMARPWDGVHHTTVHTVIKTTVRQLWDWWWRHLVPSGWSLHKATWEGAAGEIWSNYLRRNKQKLHDEQCWVFLRFCSALVAFYWKVAQQEMSAEGQDTELRAQNWNSNRGRLHRRASAGIYRTPAQPVELTSTRNLFFAFSSR